MVESGYPRGQDAKVESHAVFIKRNEYGIRNGSLSLCTKNGKHIVSGLLQKATDLFCSA
jgi:hypothetical protein